jgi:hypothetical protein
VDREKDRFTAMKAKYDSLMHKFSKTKLDAGLQINAENTKLKMENQRLREQLTLNDQVLDKYIKAVGCSYSDNIR